LFWSILDTWFTFHTGQMVYTSAGAIQVRSLQADSTRANASATLMPSTAAERMPPA
jgi:hypothetical protein